MTRRMIEDAVRKAVQRLYRGAKPHPKLVANAYRGLFSTIEKGEVSEFFEMMSRKEKELAEEAARILGVHENYFQKEIAWFG